MKYCRDSYLSNTMIKIFMLLRLYNLPWGNGNKVIKCNWSLNILQIIQLLSFLSYSGHYSRLFFFKSSIYESAQIGIIVCLLYKNSPTPINTAIEPAIPVTYVKSPLHLAMITFGPSINRCPDGVSSASLAMFPSQ
jgi:hypothetical protein